MWNRVRIVEVAARQPVTVAEAKQHCRIDVSQDDALITGYIAATRELCERITGLALSRQIVADEWDTWPSSPFLLRVQPVQEIVAIRYILENGTEQIVPSSIFELSQGLPSSVALKSGESWPDAALRSQSGVLVEYVTGFGKELNFTASSGIFTAANHGLSDGQDVLVRSTGALPSGLSSDTRYYVRDATTNTFRLSTEPGGVAVATGTDGSGSHILTIGIPAALRQWILYGVALAYDQRGPATAPQMLAMPFAMTSIAMNCSLYSF